MSTFYANEHATIYPFKNGDGKWVFVVSDDFRFQYGDDFGPVFTIERGFETDLGSIPWWIRFVFNPANPRCARAYVTHDWVNKLTAGRPPGPGVWSSQAAVGVLYDALAIDGEPFPSRAIQSLGVFLGIAKKER